MVLQHNSFFKKSKTIEWPNTALLKTWKKGKVVRNILNKRTSLAAASLMMTIASFYGALGTRPCCSSQCGRSGIFCQESPNIVFG
jgi:hypothetical protein